MKWQMLKITIRNRFRRRSERSFSFIKSDHFSYKSLTTEGLCYSLRALSFTHLSMSSCTPKILVQDQHFSIAICTTCHRIGFNYNNLLAGFDKTEFTHFSRNILASNFFEFAMRFPPNGQLRTVVKTCHKDIQMAFSESEFAELKDILQQTLLMLEMEDILSESPD